MSTSFVIAASPQRFSPQDVPFSAPLFCSLTNLILNFDPIGWGLPYGATVSRAGELARLLEKAAQVMIALLVTIIIIHHIHHHESSSSTSLVVIFIIIITMTITIVIIHHLDHHLSFRSTHAGSHCAAGLRHTGGALSGHSRSKAESAQVASERVSVCSADHRIHGRRK